MAYVSAKQTKLILHFSTRFPQISTEGKSLKSPSSKQAFKIKIKNLKLGNTLMKLHISH